MFAEYKERLAGVVGDEAAAAGIVAESLFLVCAGSDDIANNYYLAPVRPLQYDISAYVDFLVEQACDFIRVSDIFFLQSPLAAQSHLLATHCHACAWRLSSNCTSKGPGGSRSWGCRRSGACPRSGPSPAAWPGTATPLATTRRSCTTPG